jgi:hypothetical protein
MRGGRACGLVVEAQRRINIRIICATNRVAMRRAFSSRLTQRDIGEAAACRRPSSLVLNKTKTPSDPDATRARILKLAS